MTTREAAHERACGYAAGREDASGIKTVPKPGSHHGRDFGWMDFADAFAQAQDEYNNGQRGMMTNCKAAYERWTETGGRTINDEADERAAAIRAAHAAGARRAWTDSEIPDDALDRALGAADSAASTEPCCYGHHYGRPHAGGPDLPVSGKF